MIERLVDISNGALLGMFAIWALYFLRPPFEDAPKRLRQWTGALMLVCGVQTLLYVACSFFIPIMVEDVGTSLTLGLLAVPFIVFVMMELTRFCHVTFKRVMIHLTFPVILTAVYMAQLIWDENSTNSAQMPGRYVTLMIFCIWMGGYISYYFYRFALAFHRYEEIVGDIYADVEGRSINWLRRVVVILFGILVLYFILIMLLDEHWTWVTYNVLVGLFMMSLCHNISLMRNNQAIEVEEETQTVMEPTEQDSTEERSDMISNLKKLMVEHELYLQLDLTRETAARALGTNHIELTRRIKSETGLTFSQFVTTLRLEHAAELLTSTAMTADEILNACGFRSSSTFYRQFAEHYHCSPIEYRQKGS